MYIYCFDIAMAIERGAIEVVVSITCVCVCWSIGSWGYSIIFASQREMIVHQMFIILVLNKKGILSLGELGHDA